MRLCAVDSLLRLDSRPMTQRTRFGLVVLVSSFGFALAHCTTTPPKPIQIDSAVREIKVTVKDQYSPERVVVKKDSLFVWSSIATTTPITRTRSSFKISRSGKILRSETKPSSS